MLKVAALSLLMLFAASPVVRAASSAEATAAAAATAYAEGDYAAAAQSYAELTWERAVRDADVWYNAGNAFARTDQRGAAIAAYRTALVLDPAHTDASVNLIYLRGQVEDGAEDAQSFVRWLLEPATRVPLGTWRALAAGAWAAVWTLAVVALWRRSWRRLAAVAGVVCAVAIAGWAMNLAARSLEPRAIVVAAVAPLRTGPGPDYLVTYTLPDGAECALIARQAGWVQVQLADGGTGWTEAERVLALPLGEPQPRRAPVRWEEAA